MRPSRCSACERSRACPAAARPPAHRPGQARARRSCSRLLSPVSMTMRTPSACSIRMASPVGFDRIGDANDRRDFTVDHHKHDGLAFAAKLVGSVLQDSDIDTESVQQPQITRPQRDGLQRYPGHLDRLPREPAHLRRTNRLSRSPRPTIAVGQRVFASGSRLAGSRRTSASPISADRHERRESGPAFGQRAGLVDDQCVDRFEPLERFGVLNEHAGRRASTRADHDRHRRGEPERTRAGDDQHGHGARRARRRVGAPVHISPTRRNVNTAN